MQSNAIETHTLTHRFGTVLALDRLDIRVPEGSIYAFLGPNGAGKTTTIRAMLGLIRPTSGEVRMFGEPLAARRRVLLRRVGSLVETPSLYPHLTGRENLEVKRRLIGGERSEVPRVLHIVDLTADADRLVRGYSLGMQQRLGLAKALVGQPDLLILDEPTSGLDPAGMVELRQLIRRLPDEHGITVFLSSHLLGEVERVATHVGIIGQGRLLFEGTPAELHGRTGERVTVSIDHPAQASKMLTQAGCDVEDRSDGRLLVHLNSPWTTADVNALLVRGGYRVNELYANRPSLEELFLQLTSNSQLGRRAS